MLKKYHDYVKEVSTNVKEVSIERLTQFYVETLLIIDIREESECKEGMIPGAIMIPRGVLESKIFAALTNHRKANDTGIYLICRSGMRSILAAQSLQDMGFKNVYSIHGGMQRWIEKGLIIA